MPPWQSTRPEGIVAIFGCSHAGYINILKAIGEKFPDKKILSLVGGLHSGIGIDETVLEKDHDLYRPSEDRQFHHLWRATAPAKAPSRLSRTTYGNDVVRPYGSGTVITY